MDAASLPVVVLGFANSDADLAELREESRRLQALFEPLDDKACCLVYRPHLTIDELYSLIQSEGQRIAILHLAGHADDSRLLLDSLTGAQSADRSGLAHLVAEMRGLKLVFFNACSTAQHAEALIDLGVPAVVATAQPISDAAACAFAQAFYQALTGADGRDIRGAFDSAAQYMTTRFGTSAAAVTSRQMGPRDHSSSEALPWSLYLRSGVPSAGCWGLYDSDPYFGLPPISDDIPRLRKPFRYLDRFERAHAHAFFGRGRAIQRLYSELSNRSGRSILLFHGATGAGKSSVLEAGLLPRLEKTFQVMVARRDPSLGLAGTLRQALEPENGGSPIELRARWLARESQTAGALPLLVVLDQAEEAFTRPMSDVPPEHEVAELASVLRTLFVQALPEQRPRGRVIVSFRKEWLPEFLKAFDEASLVCAEILLSPLERDEMIEAIEGPASQSRDSERFHFSVEPGLARTMADDLLADPDAREAVAPTLQVALSQMWDSFAEDAAERHFSRALYEDRRKKGLLLRHFLESRLGTTGGPGSGASLAERCGEDSVSGLVLDLLRTHTTSWGAARPFEFERLVERYAHIERARLAWLIDELVNSYLLVRLQGGQPHAPPRTTLAHDTLASLIVERFHLSAAPGQRAWRILVNRAAEWSGDRVGTTLDRADLAIALRGRRGMRNWNPDERRLVVASQERLASQRRRDLKRRANRYLSVIGQDDRALHAAELDELERLSHEKGKYVRLAIFRLALRHPARARQLSNRSEMMVIAGVRFDWDLRERVCRSVEAALTGGDRGRQAPDPDIGMCAVNVGLELGMGRSAASATFNTAAIEAVLAASRAGKLPFERAVGALVRLAPTASGPARVRLVEWMGETISGLRQPQFAAAIDLVRLLAATERADLELATAARLESLLAESYTHPAALVGMARFAAAWQGRLAPRLLLQIARRALADIPRTTPINGLAELPSVAAIAAPLLEETSAWELCQDVIEQIQTAVGLPRYVAGSVPDSRSPKVSSTHPLAPPANPQPFWKTVWSIARPFLGIPPASGTLGIPIPDFAAAPQPRDLMLRVALKAPERFEAMFAFLRPLVARLPVAQASTARQSLERLVSVPDVWQSARNLEEVVACLDSLQGGPGTSTAAALAKRIGESLPAILATGAATLTRVVGRLPAEARGDLAGRLLEQLDPVISGASTDELACLHEALQALASPDTYPRRSAITARLCGQIGSAPPRPLALIARVLSAEGGTVAAETWSRVLDRVRQLADRADLPGLKALAEVVCRAPERDDTRVERLVDAAFHGLEGSRTVHFAGGQVGTIDFSSALGDVAQVVGWLGQVMTPLQLLLFLKRPRSAGSIAARARELLAERLGYPRGEAPSSTWELLDWIEARGSTDPDLAGLVEAVVDGGRSS